MKKKILQTIREHALIEKDMHIVIGLSGGPDSMCMFDVLCSMAEEWRLQLHPVHVNHKFRPGAAEEDQEFVEEYCEKAGWPCRSFVYDCSAIAMAEGLTSEEAGRKARYEAFGKVADEIAGGCLPGLGGRVPREKIAIAVGQNANDQCETLLLRLMRGTGVDGLSGIAYKRWDQQGTSVIRPLLDCSRQDIEAYCQERNLQPRRDHTNEEPVYMRNKIRLELVPLLQRNYNPNIIETMNRLAAVASQDVDFIREQAELFFEKAVCGMEGSQVELSTEVLTQLHPAIRVRLYNKALEQIGLRENISAAHLDGLEAVLRSNRPSACWNLPEGYLAEKRYDRLCFRWMSKKVEICGIDHFNQADSLGQLEVRVSSIGDSSTVPAVPHRNPVDEDAFAAAPVPADVGGTEISPLTAHFSLQALQQVYGPGAAEKIVLRTRQDGDYIMIGTGDGELHRKKLQDIFVDLKIPKSLRSQIPLAAIGKEILWILPGLQDVPGPAEKPGRECMPANGTEMTRLGRKGRYSAGYKVEDNSASPIIVLEYLFQV